jgi:hypothetical protein
MAILAEPIEALITEMVLEVIDSPDLVTAISAKPAEAGNDLAEGIAADEAALDQLATDYYADRVIERSEYFAARDALTRRLEANRQQLAKANGYSRLAELAGAGEKLRGAWSAGTLDWRRTLIGAVLDHAVIEPAIRGRNMFDPSRVKPFWRH